MEPAVELRQLSKSFRVDCARRGGVAARLENLLCAQTETVLAIDRLSFSIAPGGRVAFIGPNGAGKSTTLKVLAWLAFQIGTVFGQRSQLWYQLPPRGTFELLGRGYELDPRRVPGRRKSDGPRCLCSWLPSAPAR